jgi:hypothetical protein
LDGQVLSELIQQSKAELLALAIPAGVKLENNLATPDQSDGQGLTVPGGSVSEEELHLEAIMPSGDGQIVEDRRNGGPVTSH